MNGQEKVLLFLAIALALVLLLRRGTRRDVLTSGQSDPAGSSEGSSEERSGVRISDIGEATDFPWRRSDWLMWR